VSLQDRLRRVPQDADAWAALGLAYVEQARVTVDPTYYGKAEGALKRSLTIDSRDNFTADAGMAALASARHDFTAARDWARRGLAVNPANATLARASYAWELRGDLEQARDLMQRALDDAPTGSDRAFARYYLGDLAFNAGDPAAALDQYQRGLAADESSAPLLAGKAKAEAALGQTDAAVADYAAVVGRVPQPSYLVEYGELLESLGRHDEAAQQYRLFASEGKLLESNGVALDVDPVLFHADHGDPHVALRYAEAGIRTRPFVEMDDAYAWALHVNGRDAEALTWSQKALALGTRTALFHYHAGVIRQALGNVGGARAELGQALSINPHFSPLWAPAARQALEQLGGQP
jgi:tetratricopeptide (TPR) repeat protein